jgi:hypothetical protein
MESSKIKGQNEQSERYVGKKQTAQGRVSEHSS